MECSQIVGTTVEEMKARWLMIEERILRYAAMVKNKGISDVIAQYNLCEQTSGWIKHW